MAHVSTDDGGFTYTIDKRPPKGGWTVEALLEAHGLNPSDWWVSDVRAVGNQYGKVDDPNEQVKLAVTAKPIRAHGSAIKPPDLSDWKPLPKPKPRKAGLAPIKAVVISDHHAPRNEKTFHKLFVQWLRDTQPDIIDVNGDLCDFPSVGNHPTEDEYNHDVNECLRGALHILRDYRDACPNAEIRLRRGNHDARLQIRQQDKVPEIVNVAPGGGLTFEGEEDPRPWHDLGRLLYLDLMHIEYNPDPWKQAKGKLSKKLTVRHGFSTSPNAGKAMLDKLSGSTIQGHDHRLSLTYATEHTGDKDDPLRVRLGMSGGCAADIPGGLGYVNGGEPNWQNGATEVTIYENGDFHATPMVYLPGRLMCSDRRYVA